MLRPIPLVSLLLLSACAARSSPADSPATGGTHEGDGAESSVPDGEDSGSELRAPDPIPWRVLVYMVGDNDLEGWVKHDLDELEQGLPDDAQVGALVLADRAEGFATNDGDWTDTRLFRIVPDEKARAVDSPAIEEWGEANMADPATLEAFLDRADALMPAEHTILVLWNHGTSWTATAGEGPPPPGFGWDEQSGDDLSISSGELQAGLHAAVERNGRFDVVAFDACNMAGWEVGLSLQPAAEVMVAAQTTVGMQGLQYTPLIEALRADPTQDAPSVAAAMAAAAVRGGGERTFSAIDLDRLPAVSAVLDGLAEDALSDPKAWDRLLVARAAAGSPEAGARWRLSFLDAADLGAALADEGGPGEALIDVVDAAVIASAKADGVRPAGGLNVYADTALLVPYARGTGAVWARRTAWDDLLVQIAAEEAAAAR
ncbi:MAG: hypothetical protein JNM72_00075 [Deltaproteobacteria bacterium]|nr:hypothetical protein [Deltaproteobacteria bacterium]